MPGHVGILGKAAGGAPTDPFTLATWHSAWWASDPNWTNPGDGNVVSSIIDGSGNSRTATGSGANRPTFRSSVAALNNKPGIEHGGTHYMTTGSFTGITQPITAVGIFAVTSLAAQGYWLGYYGGGSAAQDSGSYIETTGAFGIYAGVSLSGGTASTGVGYCVFAYANQGSSTIKVNGSTVASGNVGNRGVSTGFTMWRVAAYGNGTSAPGRIRWGFLGVKVGALTGGEETAIRSWAQSFYGTA